MKDDIFKAAIISIALSLMSGIGFVYLGSAGEDSVLSSAGWLLLGLAMYFALVAIMYGRRGGSNKINVLVGIIIYFGVTLGSLIWYLI